MKHSHKHLIAGALLAGLGLAAIAQTPPAAPAGPGAPAQSMHDGSPGFDPARMQQRRMERHARRLAIVKQKLGIIPAQEGAWNAWTTAMQPQARPLQRPDRLQFETMTTPERIDRMRAIRGQRMAEADRRAEATKTFYGALDTEQRKLFDEISLRMGKRGHRGLHGGFGRG